MTDESALDPGGSDRAVYVISVASELTGVHPQTLRVWDRRGLVSPARTGGMSRRYSDNDVARIRKVHQLTAQGLTLAGVTRILQLEEQVQTLEQQVSDLRDRLTQGAIEPSSGAVGGGAHGVALVPLRQDVVRWRSPIVAGGAVRRRNSVRRFRQD